MGKCAHGKVLAVLAVCAGVAAARPPPCGSMSPSTASGAVAGVNSRCGAWERSGCREEGRVGGAMDI